MTDDRSNLNDASLDLARYIDGLLDAPDRARIERALSASPTLRAELDAMRNVDAALRRMFGPGAADSSAQQTTLPFATAHHGPVRRSRFIPIAAAAMVALGALTTLLWLWPRPSAAYDAADLYASLIDAGYKPVWICADEAEFRKYTRETFGQALAPNPQPSIELVGWTYERNLTDLGFDKYTAIILAHVDGKEVIGVFDPTGAGHLPADETGKLNVFQQRLGPLPFFEISPFDAPRLHESMRVIEGDTMDIRSGSAPNEPRP